MVENLFLPLFFCLTREETKLQESLVGLDCKLICLSFLLFIFFWKSHCLVLCIIHCILECILVLSHLEFSWSSTVISSWSPFHYPHVYHQRTWPSTQLWMHIILTTLRKSLCKNCHHHFTSNRYRIFFLCDSCFCIVFFISFLTLISHAFFMGSTPFHSVDGKLLDDALAFSCLAIDLHTFLTWLDLMHKQTLNHGLFACWPLKTMHNNSITTHFHRNCRQNRSHGHREWVLPLYTHVKCDSTAGTTTEPSDAPTKRQQQSRVFSLEWHGKH